MTLTGDTQSLKIEVDSKLSHTVMVAMAIRGLCGMTPLTAVETDRVELCLIEVLNNAIVHAYEKQPGHIVETVVVLSRSLISITVSDWGRSIPEDVSGCLHATETVKTVPGIKASGRGLLIVKSLMDTVSYSSEGGKNSFFMKMGIEKG